MLQTVSSQALIKFYLIIHSGEAKMARLDVSHISFLCASWFLKQYTSMLSERASLDQQTCCFRQ